uniref:proline-rich protein 23A-like n=1 Tax=Jaculus jaculus TaxID=51337 RepID=UPI001E1B2DB4|nr:proline-rich protein 23A-like [Jaculus jaculus]
MHQHLKEPAHPGPWWRPQPEGPGPAMRQHLREPVRRQPLGLPLQAGPPATSMSLMILPTGCLVSVPGEGTDLLLEPPPTSALQVLLPDHELFVIPEGLVHTINMRPGDPGLLGGDPRIPRMDAAANCGDVLFPGPCPPALCPTPERHTAGPTDEMVHMLRPFPGSPLNPLPPSPPESPQRNPPKAPKPRRPPSKVCRRLF